MSFVILSEGQEYNLTSWTIVGSVRDGIVSHVAVLAKDVVDIRLGDSVPVYQMGPPLTTIVPVLGPESEENPDPSDIQDAEASYRPLDGLYVVAYLGDLSDDEKRGMRRWHRRISGYFLETTRPRKVHRGDSREANVGARLESMHYIAHPPIKKEVDTKTGNLKAIWYSCAGFVLDCYESNVVQELLLSWEESSFPKVHEETIKKVWCRNPSLELIPELKDALGLLGESPWPVVMPGYIVNAFRREATKIRSEPFCPTDNDVAVG